MFAVVVSSRTCWVVHIFSLAPIPARRAPNPPPLAAESTKSYGFLDDRVRRRCRLHKLPGMVDVKSPRCEFPMCGKQPCCGHLGAKARFCSAHKQDGMVNLKVRGADGEGEWRSCGVARCGAG